MAGLLTFFLAEGINTGITDHEGWGGLFGIAVVFAAVFRFILIARNLGRGTGEDSAGPKEASGESEAHSETGDHAEANPHP